MAEIASAPDQYQGYEKNWDVERAVRHIDAILRMARATERVILGVRDKDIPEGLVSFYSRPEKGKGSDWVPNWAKNEAGEIASEKQFPTLYLGKRYIWQFYKDIPPWVRRKK
jgi:hypothetical protein